MPSFVEPPSQNPNMWQIWDYLRTDIWGYILAAITFDASGKQIYWDLIGWDLDRMWTRGEEFTLASVRALDEWAETAVNDAKWAANYALGWALDAWDGLGYSIQVGWYTAVTWAEAKRDEAKDFAEWLTQGIRNGWDAVWEWYDKKSGMVWAWINDKSGQVWDWIRDWSKVVGDWIRDKSGTVWDWIDGIGRSIEDWWNRTNLAISAWVDNYMEFYQDLFEDHRDDVQDLFEDPGQWIADRLLDSLEYLAEQAVLRYW